MTNCSIKLRNNRCRLDLNGHYKLSIKINDKFKLAREDNLPGGARSRQDQDPKVPTHDRG